MSDCGRVCSHKLLGVEENDFFLNGAATTEIYTLSLHDALPIWTSIGGRSARYSDSWRCNSSCSRAAIRSEEHTSELQSQFHLVCRLLLEKKKIISTEYELLIGHFSLVVLLQIRKF